MKVLRKIGMALAFATASVGGAAASTIADQFPFFENKEFPDLLASLTGFGAADGPGDGFSYTAGTGELFWQDTRALNIEEDTDGGDGSTGVVSNPVISGELRATAFINTDGTLSSGNIGAGETGAGKLTITGAYTSPILGVITPNTTDVLIEADLLAVGFGAGASAPIELLWKLRPLPVSNAQPLFQDFVISRHNFNVQQGAGFLANPFAQSFNFPSFPFDGMTVDVQRYGPIPLPAGLPLLLTGVAGVAWLARRRRAG